MAISRKRPKGSCVAVALSGGVDSVVLLHCLSRQFSVSAVHVHHGLSPNADRWASFCRRLCRRLDIPLALHKVKVSRSGRGLEAAAREARYAVFEKIPAPVLALAHNLDDQAETVLMNLLRGAGVRGARGMLPSASFKGKTLVRPLLDVPREQILAYARAHRLEWIEDESNADQALTRNFIRRSVGPLLARKFPRWKESLGRAARHFSKKEAGQEELLRAFLRARGLKAPSEAKLAEMLKQLAAGGQRTAIAHDGVTLRTYRGSVAVDRAPPGGFRPLTWNGEARLPIPALGGELRFKRVRGKGFSANSGPLEVRLRQGGERLQPDPRRPRRTLKNLFQEAGVPPWERDRLPLLVRGGDLVWAPGLGVDAGHRAPGNSAGWLPEWRKIAG